jgi:3-dehydroquinate synthase
MQLVRVKLDRAGYAIVIKDGCIRELGPYVRRCVGETTARAVLVSNPTVDRLYGRRAAKSLRESGFRVQRYLIGDGERFKSLRTAEALYGSLIAGGVERGDTIVALGGGVVGDLAGFVAATYHRGIRFINVPTTLLAQIDSSVGGKTGVNHRLGKNLIGVFHQPSLVLIDPETLRTLPAREMTAGLCEAVKYGIIRDSALFEWTVAGMDLLKKGDPRAISYLIKRCCEIKAEVVARDEREGSLRRVLNFGHTVGHALEAVTGYRRFLHGEAVGHGMRAAARIAETMGLLGSEPRQAIDDAIRLVGRLPRTDDLALSGIIAAMRHDKKATAGRIVMVLPLGIGDVVIRSDVPPNTVRRALKDSLLRQTPAALRSE